MYELYKSIRCNCGDDGCSDWHVTPGADVHGVSFTEEQAKAIASLLNGMEE